MFPLIFFLAEQHFFLLGRHFGHLSKNILYNRPVQKSVKRLTLMCYFYLFWPLILTKLYILGYMRHFFTVHYTAVQKFGISKVFKKKFLMLINVVSIWNIIAILKKVFYFNIF